MKKNVYAVLTAIVILLEVCGCAKGTGEMNRPPNKPAGKIRLPAAIGFYGGNASALDEEVGRLLSSAKTEPPGGEVIALIVPHAGYRYSGSIAASAYSLLRKGEFENVIVVGPSHYVALDGAVLGDEEYYRTPLGDVKVNKEISSELAAEDEITIEGLALAQEHSVEVQLPFLQKALGSFNLVPVVMGMPSAENCDRLARALEKLVRNHPGTLLVASSDMSHYYPYDVAKKMDLTAINSIEKLDGFALVRDIRARKCELCGEGPVLTIMKVAKLLGAKEAKLLTYANSGDTAGDKSKVVGYSAFSLSKERVVRETDGGSLFSHDERERLLDLARDSIASRLAPGKKVDLNGSNSVENEKCGAFVTLTQNGRLRGCIGFTQPTYPLWQTINRAAVAAATEDPRFSPVRLEELDKLEIEISVLTPMEKVNDISEIIVGKHGLLIKKGSYSGLLLPQVATEYCWDRTQFLDQTCLKAGLPPGAWKDGAEIYKFSAEIFSERRAQ